MAIDKAVDSTALDGLFTAIANAIRSKTGGSNTMTPAQMATEIASMQTGDTFSDLVLTGTKTSYSNSTVTSIPNYTFSHNNYIEDVTFENVETIGDYAFHYSHLKTFSFPKVKAIGTYAFEQTRLTGTVTLPSTITSIGPRAFNAVNSATFTKVVFEGQAPDLPSRAFRGNARLEEFDFTHCTTVPALANTDAFDLLSDNFKIIVPDDLYNTWIAASNWVTYASHIIKETDFNAL